jgi:hypothetical protein
MSDDLYLQALQNFLKSDDWKESLLIFIRANCLYFENVQDFHAQQHVIWKNFQEIAENVVQIGLMMVGGSIEELERGLDDVYSRPSRGPRDEVIKDIIQSLHTVEDFHQFARMMNKHCHELMEEENGVSIGIDGIGNPYDMLMRMGFTVDHINSAYERLGKTSGLEEVIGYLSARATELEEQEAELDLQRKKKLAMKKQQQQQQPREVSTGSSSASSSRPAAAARQARTPPKRVNNYAYYESQDKQSASSSGNDEYTREPLGSPRNTQEPSPQPHGGKKKKKKQRSSTTGGNGNSGSEITSVRPYMKYIEEAAADGLEIDINELNVKFSTADSVLESYQELQRTTNGNAIDETLLDLAKWAADMKQLQSDILEAYESNVHSRDMCFNHTHGLVAWYQELEQHRHELNQQTNGLTGDLLSDSEMKRMAELDKIAAEGRNEDEQNLHALLSRHETVRKEIQNFYRKISIVISTNHLRRPLVEETYLFLKEQVGSNRSLDDIFTSASSSSSVIHKIVSAPGGIEVINLFLELQTLEEEQQFLKIEINTLLGIPLDANSSGSSTSAAASGGNDVMGGFGGGGDGIHLDEIFAASNVADEKFGTINDKSSAAADAKMIANKTIAEGKDGMSDAKGGLDSKHGQSTSNVDGIDSNTNKSKQETITSPGGLNKNASTSNMIVNHDSDLISGLKQNHRDALDKLKAALEADKLKKMHDLENRLLLRKKKLQQRKSSGESKGDDTLSIEEEEGVIQLLEEEIRGVEQQYLLKQQCLMDGLKYHCINELKAARQVLEENPHIAKKENQFQQLIRSKQEDIDINAVNALKEKYEHDKNQLLDYYTNERQRQRAKMLKTLEKRKGNGNGSVNGMSVEEMEKELANIDEKIDREMHTNLSNLREQLLLGLGGVNVIQEISADNMTIQRNKKSKSSYGADDYDDYLNGNDQDIDQTRKNHQKTLNYVDQVDAMKKMYVDAGQKLQKDLFAKKYNKGKKRQVSNGVFDETVMDTERAEYEQLVNVVDNMVLDAYKTHVMDLSAGLKDHDKEETSLPMSLRKMSITPSASSDQSHKEMEERMKAGMLEAFEKAKINLIESQDNQRKRTQDKLVARRQQRAGKHHGGGEGKDDNDDGTAVADDSISEAILEEVMDSFLQPPSTNTSKASPSSTANAKSISQPIVASTNIRSMAGAENDANLLEQEKAKILTSHNEKEKALVDDLYATMMDKKKKLEDR